MLPESCAPLQTLQTPQACACTRGPACHPRFLPPRLPLSLSCHSRRNELSSSGGLIGTVSQPPGSHPKPPSIQWPCFELLPLPRLCACPLPSSCLHTVTPEHGLEVCQLSPGSLGRCLHGWGQRGTLCPSSTSLRRLRCGSVYGLEFPVCFCLNKGFLPTVRKRLQVLSRFCTPSKPPVFTLVPSETDSILSPLLSPCRYL